MFDKKTMTPSSRTKTYTVTVKVKIEANGPDIDLQLDPFLTSRIEEAVAHAHRAAASSGKNNTDTNMQSRRESNGLAALTATVQVPAPVQDEVQFVAYKPAARTTTTTANNNQSAPSTAAQQSPIAPRNARLEVSNKKVQSLPNVLPIDLYLPSSDLLPTLSDKPSPIQGTTANSSPNMANAAQPLPMKRRAVVPQGMQTAIPPYARKAKI